MTVVERLTLEAAQADTMLACEHRQRYEFAARLCGGQRVLDLCCGSGYGTAILAAHAREVLGVDNDAATVDLARVTVARDYPNIRFETADAVTFLRRDLVAELDTIVCFEGLEHLHGLDGALERLCELARDGLRIVASVPNGKLFEEENPHHVTEFGYHEAVRAFAPFPATVMVPQFLAEGSLICPEGAEETEVAVTLGDGGEPEYANHFIFCVNVDPGAARRAHHGRLQLNASPLFNRWAEDLKRGAWALRRENARLARARLGKAGSAAAAALASVAEREGQITALAERCRVAEARVLELEAALGRLKDGCSSAPDGPASSSATEGPEPSSDARQAPVATQIDGASVEIGARRDEAIAIPISPASAQDELERARRHLIPWIEATVSLAGKTVLDCRGDQGALATAVGERAARVIAIAPDPSELAAAREEVDVVLLDGVLEHLAVSDRLELLRATRDVVRPDGLIVVTATPNRLVYSGDDPGEPSFVHLLPEELVSHSVESRRSGVSFHEFEMVFGDLARHVVASGYDERLLPIRPVQPEEILLARYLARVRPDLASAWSRASLDLILSSQPIAKRPSFLQPWSASTIGSEHVDWTSSDDLYLAGPGATLWMSFPQPTRRIVVGTVGQDDAGLELDVRPDGLSQTLRVTVSASGARATTFTAFGFPDASRRIALSPSAACRVTFVGYED